MKSLCMLTPKLVKLITFDEDVNLLKPQDFFTGAAADRVMKFCGKDDPSVLQFLGKMKNSYIKCAKHMQKTLPLNNKVLKSLAALDPVIATDTQGLKLLKRLSLEHFPPLLTDEEKDTVGKEILYSVDHTHDSPTEVNVVQWWSKIMDRNCYPVLSRAAVAALSIFQWSQHSAHLEM